MSVLTFEKKFNQFISSKRSYTLSLEHVFDYPSISEIYQKVCKYHGSNGVQNSNAKQKFSAMLSDLKAVGLDVKDDFKPGDDPLSLSINEWFLPIIREFDRENRSKSWYLEESRNKYIDKFFFNSAKYDGTAYFKHIGSVLNVLLKDKKYASNATDESILKNLSVVAKNFTNKTVFSCFPLAFIASEVKDQRIQKLLKDNASDFFPPDDDMFKKISNVRRHAAIWLRKDINAGNLSQKTQEWFEKIDVSVPDDYQFYQQVEVPSRFKKAFRVPENFLLFVVNSEEATNYKLETRVNFNVASQLGVFSAVSIALNNQYGSDIVNFLPSMGDYTSDDEKYFKENMLVDYLVGNDYYFTAISPEVYNKFKEPSLVERMNDVAGYILENNLFQGLSAKEKYLVVGKTFGLLEAKKQQDELDKVIEKVVNHNLSDASSEDASKTFKL